MYNYPQIKKLQANHISAEYKSMNWALHLHIRDFTGLVVYINRRIILLLSMACFQFQNECWKPLSRSLSNGSGRGHGLGYCRILSEVTSRAQARLTPELCGALHKVNKNCPKLHWLCLYEPVCVCDLEEGQDSRAAAKRENLEEGVWCCKNYKPGDSRKITKGVSRSFSRCIKITQSVTSHTMRILMIVCV